MQLSFRSYYGFVSFKNKFKAQVLDRKAYKSICNNFEKKRMLKQEINILNI